MSDSTEAESERLVLSGLDEGLSGKLPPGCTEPSMSVDAVSQP